MDRPNVTEPGVTILNGDALALVLPDDSVDLVVTSPQYCGHPECPAFGSWEPLREVNVTSIKPADERMARSWAEREEPTWLDR